MHSPNLDLLRASAVTMVVITHWLESAGHYGHQVVSLGYAGVMIFFVHTACVLMQSLERLENESHGRIAARFYIRRLFRIYPLSILVILIFIVVARIFPMAESFWFTVYQPTFSQLAANLSLTQNVFGVREVVGVMWSLPPEVQMYLTLPIFFAFRKLLPTSILIFWSGWVIMLTFIQGTKAFDLLGYMPMFVPGIIAFHYFKRITPRIPGWLLPLAVAIPIVPFVLFSHRSAIISWFTCLAVGVAVPHFRPIDSKMVAKGAELVARYSYGIYLTNLGCLFIASRTFLTYGRIPALTAATVLTAVSAFILYHSVERPMIKLGVDIADKLLQLKTQRAYATHV